MTSFFDQIFGSQYDTLRRNLQGATDQAAGDAMRVTNAAANRGATSPMALASASARASQQQRGAMAGQHAAMLQQAQAADQQRGFQLLGTGLQTAGSLLGMIYPGAQVAGKVAGDFTKQIGAAQAGQQAPAALPPAQVTNFAMPASPASLLGNPGIGAPAAQPAPQAPAPVQTAQAPAPQAAPLLPPPSGPSSAEIMSQIPQGGPAPAPGSMVERGGLPGGLGFISPEMFRLILSGGGFGG